jgi:uncharacterized lipoprotein YajG
MVAVPLIVAERRRWIEGSLELSEGLGRANARLRHLLPALLAGVVILAGCATGGTSTPAPTAGAATQQPATAAATATQEVAEAPAEEATAVATAAAEVTAAPT